MPVVNALSDVDPTAITICKQGANRQRIFLKKEHAPADKLITVASDRPILRKTAGDDWSVFYCVVAEPDAMEDPGLVGDGETADVWASPDEIRKAAHRLLKNGAYVNAVHDGEPAPDCAIVESAIALSDIEVFGGDGTMTTIKKDSWYVAIEPGDEFKAQVDSGAITGVSMEATGYRTLIEKAQDSTRKGKFKRAMKALADLVGEPIHEGDLTPEAIAKAVGDPALVNAPTFASLVAQYELQDELPQALWALQDAIYYAFDPLYGDTDGDYDPLDNITQSLNEFAAWAKAKTAALVPADTADKAGEAQAIQKARETLKKNRPHQEDDDVPITDEQFAELQKTSQATAEALGTVATLLKERLPEPTEKDKLQKQAEEHKTALQAIQKSLEKLGEGSSTDVTTSDDDPKALLEELRKVDPKAAQEFEYAHALLA